MAEAPPWVERFLSPFYQGPADALVSSTVPPGSLSVLLAVVLVDIAVASWLLGRRDFAA